MPSRQQLIAQMKKMGQYPTPPKIIDAILSVLKPSVNASVLDPGCGHGNIISRLVDAGIQTVYGYDIDPDMVASTKERVDNRAIIEQRDVLVEGLPREYDFIIANPPFSPNRPETANNFRTRSAHPTAQFIELCLNSLTPDGRLAVIVDRGLCTSEKHRQTRAILMQQAYIDIVLELRESAFGKEAGTTFSTLLIFFRKKKVRATQFGFVKGKRKPDPVDYEEMRKANDWFYGSYKYRHHHGTRLGDFVDVIKQHCVEGNELNPRVDSVGRFLKDSKDKRKTARKCIAGCLYISRIVQEGTRPSCAVIPQAFDGAGTTVEFYILRPKDSQDVPWLWYTLNANADVRDYMRDMARGMVPKRVLENEFLAMPMKKPDRDFRRHAEQCLAKSNEMAKLHAELYREFFS